MSQSSEDWLLDKAKINEEPFRSQARFVGPLIARFRSLWNSVSTKWYVRPLLQQQNRLNRLLVERLGDHDLRLIEQDREQTALTHDLADVATQLQMMNRRLASLERRLAQLEERAAADEDASDSES